MTTHLFRVSEEGKSAFKDPPKQEQDPKNAFLISRLLIKANSLNLQ